MPRAKSRFQKAVLAATGSSTRGKQTWVPKRKRQKTTKERIVTQRKGKQDTENDDDPAIRPTKRRNNESLCATQTDDDASDCSPPAGCLNLSRPADKRATTVRDRPRYKRNPETSNTLLSPHERAMIVLNRGLAARVSDRQCFVQDAGLSGRLLAMAHHVTCNGTEQRVCSCLYGGSYETDCFQKIVAAHLGESSEILGHEKSQIITISKGNWTMYSVKDKLSARRACVYKDSQSRIRCSAHERNSNADRCCHLQSVHQAGMTQDTNTVELEHNPTFIAPTLNDVWQDALCPSFDLPCGIVENRTGNDVIIRMHCPPPYPAIAAICRGINPRPSSSRCIKCDGDLSSGDGQRRVQGAANIVECQVREVFCQACGLGTGRKVDFPDTWAFWYIIVDDFRVACEVIDLFLVLSVKAELSMNAYYHAMKLHQSVTHNDFAPYQVFTEMVLVRMLLEEDCPIQSCISCGPRPKVIICDGTHIVMKKDALLNGDAFHHLNASSVPGMEYDVPPIIDEKFQGESKQDEEKTDGECRKLWTTSQMFTGGLFITSCQHSVITTCHIMPRSEGRRDPYYVIRRYYSMNDPPTHIIYDFSCALDAYLSKRRKQGQPISICLVDDFHSSNHTCSPKKYHLKHHRDDPALRHVKSSVVESLNAVVNRMQKTVMMSAGVRVYLILKHFHRLINGVRFLEMEAHVTE